MPQDGTQSFGAKISERKEAQVRPRAAIQMAGLMSSGAAISMIMPKRAQKTGPLISGVFPQTADVFAKKA
jgi:hypothetical protein